MAKYQPPGGRGTQPGGMLPARQLPPPDPALRQQALAAFALSSASTVAAQQACRTQFTNSVGSEIGALPNGR
jgi:hypothetical protein